MICEKVASLLCLKCENDKCEAFSLNMKCKRGLFGLIECYVCDVLEKIVFFEVLKWEIRVRLLLGSFYLTLLQDG